MKKKIAIMGSTGSIGTQALDVVRSYPEEFEITALICRNNSEAFRDQVKEFRPSKAVVVNEMGEDEVISAVTLPGVDLVVISTVGLSGLKPTLAAIKAKKDVALATKEAMVLAGSLVIEEVVK
ncbi:1-deoxy-D-xylulose-5-phosphate reductoisomerase, partial [Candidatus Shapirobacteria bacterium CG10_big_fil_rev_8_21_14_0_10_36_6]